MAGWAEQFVERFTHEVEERLAPSMPGAGREALAAAAQQAFDATVDALNHSQPPSASLPVTRLRAADVVAQGLVAMSQATLYRALEQRRFYTTTPRGKTIGRLFPAWQFVEPVPELIGSVLERLSSLPGTQIHAFWVTRADELNELSPAEVLAGLPFETTTSLHPAQRFLLDQPPVVRQQKVSEFAQQQSAGKAGIIS
ncbi:hypothetical protein ACFSQU_00095 [Massilia sp. GCM10020059]|uniref:Helix-turn-helix protein n=1 Tax=Massilia agrisoli TaxID=2892444 RepID=A0ABS8J040_9BURK|nr:hypothetical protein [Massilia agrisoli]MCC6073511.1 hypothetical protein [Massilia agrisoli]